MLPLLVLALLADGGEDCAKAVDLYVRRLPRESIRAMAGCDKTGKELFYLGLDYRMLGEHANARKYFTAALDSGYIEAFLLYALVEEERALGEKSAGMEHAQSLMTRFPESAWAHMLLGNAHFSGERDEAAAAEYELALAKDPKTPKANYRLGYLAYKAGKFDAARVWFFRELALNPHDAEANLFEGQSLSVLGRNHEAIPYLREAVASEPGSAAGFHALARALLEEKRLREAVDCLTRAEAQIPNDASFPASLARLYSELKMSSEATRAAARARGLAKKRQHAEEAPGK